MKTVADKHTENVKTAFAIVGFAFFLLILYWWIFDKPFTNV